MRAERGEPAEPQRGTEHLARRAAVDDALRIEAMECPDRRERRMQRALLAVNAAGLIGRLPRSAFTTTPVREATAEPIRHWVGGADDRRPGARARRGRHHRGRGADRGSQRSGRNRAGRDDVQLVACGRP